MALRVAEEGTGKEWMIRHEKKQNASGKTKRIDHK